MNRELHPLLAAAIFLVAMVAIFGFFNWLGEEMCKPPQYGPWYLLAEGEYAGRETVVGFVDFGGGMGSKVNTKITFETGQSVVIAGDVPVWAKPGDHIKVYTATRGSFLPGYDIVIANSERK